jgi:hypothetical protein
MFLLPIRILQKTTLRCILELTSKVIKFENRENLPKESPFLIAFNHFGWTEGLVQHILLPAKDWPYVIQYFFFLTISKNGT